ncbi:hypothetical protein CLAIMM_11181 [Cladophialophora immunda]|nr:hypothetical protein CLAIMM_11181 [Cladophialophora immunda]
MLKTNRSGVNLARVQRLTTVSDQELGLTRQITAKQTCEQQFNLYVDIWEMPMRECLSHAYSRSSNSSGFEALTKLSTNACFAKYFGEAQLLVKGCWQMASNAWGTTSSAPHLFFVVAVLDALFQHEGRSNPRASTEAREAAINETYRWVALATATQFSIRNDECDKPSLQVRDFASTAWRKARQLVFENIAATSSFRLALALLLFGLILPPAQTHPESVEDATYAQSEGVRRLQSLCAQAHSLFLDINRSKTQDLQVGMCVAKRKGNLVHALPSQVRELVLELIAIVRSLADIVNWVAIGHSWGQVYSNPPDLYECNVSDERATHAAHGTEGMTRREREVHGVTTQMRTNGTSVTVLWRQNIEEEVVLCAVQGSVSIVVMLWKSLALLIVAVSNVAEEEEDAEYGEIERQYASICALIDAWRTAFGTFDENTSLSLQHCGSSLRRSILFCSTDGDLAVLRLYEVILKLETDLRQQPSTPAKRQLLIALQSSSARREEDRRISAMQISFLAANSQGISSPGFQGRGGLKAYVQDFAAHPLPSLMIQALSLAAKTFNDEVHSCLNRMDTEAARAMMVHLDACLDGLQGLKQNLAVFPDIGPTV